jgi:hypothetical protein
VTAAYRPRRLEMQDLVGVLVEEHRLMDGGLQRAKEASARGDFEGTRRALREVDPVFRQHIADEEATILGLLIKALGVKGADEEIKVFRQHRPIYELMRKIDELASMSSEELAANQAKLQELFREHTAAEEGRVFPRALSVGRKDGPKDLRV